MLEQFPDTEGYGQKTAEALQGRYRFDINALLKQGWALTQNTKSVLIQIGVITVAVAVIGFMLLLNAFGVTDYANIPLQTEFAMNLILTFLLAPLFASLMLVATRNASGLPSSVAHWSCYLSLIVPLGLTAVLTAIIVQAGVFVFVLPGLYLKIASAFAPLLVADKGMGPTQAIWLSIRVVNRYWLQFVGLYLLFAAMALLVALTFGIALLWVGPLYLHIKGILYRDMFGLIEQARNNDQGENNNESVFHA